MCFKTSLKVLHIVFDYRSGGKTTEERKIGERHRGLQSFTLSSIFHICFAKAFSHVTLVKLYPKGKFCVAKIYFTF